jgi:hypothetical protein
MLLLTDFLAIDNIKMVAQLPRDKRQLLVPSLYVGMLHNSSLRFVQHYLHVLIKY